MILFDLLFALFSLLIYYSIVPCDFYGTQLYKLIVENVVHISCINLFTTSKLNTPSISLSMVRNELNFITDDKERWFF